jgi:hypothetical protein
VTSVIRYLRTNLKFRVKKDEVISMNRMAIPFFSLATICCLSSAAVASEPIKVTVIVRGVLCDQCVMALRESWAEVKGIKFDAEQIRRGERPRYFSEPFVIEVADSQQTSIGSLGAAVAKAKTPHQEDLPPRLNLVLYTSEVIDEDSVVALRSELMNVNGLEVVQPGGLGGFPNKGYFWVRLEPAGGADFNEILTSAKKAVRVSISKD